MLPSIQPGRCVHTPRVQSTFTVEERGEVSAEPELAIERAAVAGGQRLDDERA